MKGLMEKSRSILKFWSKEHNIGEIAKLSDSTYNKIRNNYFKHFWRKDYLNRICKGRYILNENGKLKLTNDLNLIKSKTLILKLSKRRASNKLIKEQLKEKLNFEITDSSLFSHIHSLKKLHNIKNRRIKEINIKLDKNFFEFLGLILSDGYIGKYNIDFYNKDPYLLFYYENLMKSWGQKFYKRRKDSGVYEIGVYSINLVSLVNRFLDNKKDLSKEIVNNKKIFRDYFLRGFYSGDGSVYISLCYRRSKNKWRVEPHISLAVFNKKIMDTTISILKSQGYKPYNDKNYILLNKKKDIRKFFKEIKFIEGCKIRSSKYFRGFNKNQVLNYIANYIEKNKALKNLMKRSNKKAIIAHIRNSLKSM